MIYKSVSGTRDILPAEQPYWRLIEKKIYEITALFGYDRVDPPIFEESRLFIRGVGETTDIVEKEMYTFEDKGKNSLTLRPEFTAGLIRLYLENGLYVKPKPVKLFSMGPIFRYERPQAGRFRQHTQFNVEALGEQDPSIDFEIMSVAWQLYTELGFSKLAFQLNSTGCPICRPGYVQKLKEYYQTQYNSICTDCKRRLERNAFRLLDCKESSCQPIISQAPVITQHLCTDCNDHFKSLCSYLDHFKRSYIINHKLVRGLDYYTKTVFEVWAQGIGAQSAMCGGGRYDGLIEQLGGEPTPGIGFGSGIERIILSMQEQGLQPKPEQKPAVFIIFDKEENKLTALHWIYELRAQKIPAHLSYSFKSFKAQMREANRHSARYAIIFGERELAGNMAAVKDLQDGSQIEIPQSDLVDYCTHRLGLPLKNDKK
jgi:histidyl-tRNA synthetase